MKKALLSVLLSTAITNVFAQVPVFTGIDIVSGSASSDAQPLAYINGKVILRATTTAEGAEYWVSGGTAASTTLLKDINVGAGSSYGTGGVVMNGKYYFTANDGYTNTGIELWVTDGTVAGTQQVKDINATSPGASGFIGFSTFLPHNSKLYFAADNGVNGEELWVSDGTAAGTVQVKNINPGISGSSPSDFTILSTNVIFAADSAGVGRELWITNGTAAGTYLLKDIANTGSSAPTKLTQYNGKVYFAANNGPNGTELWVTDGTTAGTVLLKDINPGPGDGVVTSNFIVYNGKLYFIANNGSDGDELWMTDGTLAGTQMVKDINTSGSAGIGYLYVANNKLYFSANDGSAGNEPYVSDGSSAGTVRLKDIISGSGASSPQNFFAYKNYTYFIAQQSAGDNQLWQTDGTTANTKVVAPIGSTTVNPNPSAIIQRLDNSSVYFNAKYDANGNELWIMKDTTGSAGIASNNSSAEGQVWNIFPNPNNGTFTLQLANADFKNAAVAVYDMMGREVYQTAITKQQTQLTPDAPKGVYTLKLQLDDAVQTKRIVVQ